MIRTCDLPDRKYQTPPLNHHAPHWSIRPFHSFITKDLCSTSLGYYSEVVQTSAPTNRASIYLVVHPSIFRLLLHFSFIRSFVYSYVHLCIYSFSCSLPTNLSNRSFMNLYINSSVHSFGHSFTHSSVHSFLHSSIRPNSFTHLFHP